MRFTIGRDQLLDICKRMQPFIIAQSPLPVLRGMHIETTEGGLVFTGTDLDLGASLSYPIEVEGQIGEQVVVYHRELQSALRTVAPKNSRILIEVEQEGDAPIPRLRVQGSTLTIRVECHKADDWPSGSLLWMRKPVLLEGDIATLVESQAPIAKAASTDRARPILNALCWEPEGERMAVTATDSYRLATITVAVSGLAEQVLVPAKLGVLAAQSGASVVMVDQERGAGQVAFASSDLTMWGRLVEGHFPKWRTLIPDGDQINLGWEFEGAELTTALAPLIASKDASKLPVRVDFEGERLYSIGGGTVQYESALCGRYSGATEEVQGMAFNPRYLADVVQVVGKRHIKAGLIDRLKPAIFYAGAFRYLLVPVRM